MGPRHKLVLAVLGISALGTCAYRCTASSTPAPARWTADDLPPVPSDNGWQTLQDTFSNGAMTPEIPDATRDAIAMLGNVSARESWASITPLRLELERFVQSPEGSRAIARWAHGTEATAFADACPMNMSVRCHHFDMFRLHRVALAEALWHAVRGDEDAALQRAAVMIRHQAQYLRSARGPMSARVSAAMLLASLGLAAVLQLRVAQGAEVSAQTQESLVTALESIDVDAAILQNIVIGSYLYTRDALAQVNSANGAAVLGDDTFWPPHWLYDEAHATARFNTAYETVMELARDPSTALPEAPEPTWTDRVLHPVTTTLLMVLDPRTLLAGQVVAMRDEFSEIQSARMALLGN
ncbi:MAG: hypothetical protein ACRBN8_27580 [Nannocystales bacterium]